MEITVTGQTFAETLGRALNQVVELVGPTNSTVDASLALPLRARESTSAALAEAMLAELLAEIGEGIQSVQIDGLMKRDGDYICWGYAFAAPDQGSPTGPAFTAHDLQVIEEPGRIEIRFTLDQSREKIDCE
jgi:hypothetical protein